MTVDIQMQHREPRTGSLPERPAVYPLLMQFPVVCFTLALFTDLLYVATQHLMWTNFSAWLLFAGVAIAVLAAITASIEYGIGRLRTRPDVVSIVGGAVAFALAVLNNFVHAGDGWVSVMPWGLTLSIATVAVMVVAAALQMTSTMRRVMRRG